MIKNMLWYDREYNFGDLIGPYLFEKITNEKPILSNNINETKYITVGSIFDSSGKNDIIWGTGILYQMQQATQPSKIMSVRGPVTRRILTKIGIKNIPKIYGDPGLLMPDYFNPIIEKKYKIGIVPHAHELSFVEKNFDDEKILIISPMDSPENVISKILQCKKIYTGSLHGLIMSIAYNIPCRQCIFGKARINGHGDLKFFDFYLSLEPEEMHDELIDFVLEYEKTKIIPKELEKFMHFDATNTKNIDNVETYKYNVPENVIKSIRKSCPFMK